MEDDQTSPLRSRKVNSKESMMKLHLIAQIDLEVASGLLLSSLRRTFSFSRSSGSFAFCLFQLSSTSTFLEVDRQSASLHQSFPSIESIGSSQSSIESPLRGVVFLLHLLAFSQRNEAPAEGIRDFLIEDQEDVQLYLKQSSWKPSRCPKKVKKSENCVSNISHKRGAIWKCWRVPLRFLLLFFCIIRPISTPVVPCIFSFVIFLSPATSEVGSAVLN